MLKDLKQFRFTNKEIKALSLEHKGFSNTTINIKAQRDQKQKSYKALTIAYKNQRGVLLIGTNYKKVLRVASKTFLNNMTYLFKRCTIREGVLYLNNEILLRN